MAQHTWYALMLLLSVAHASRNQLGLLQVKKTAVARSCPLPEDATWAEVRLTGLPAFRMAVRSNSDLVSQSVLEKGYWEVPDTSIWGTPGQALDIGGNIGYYTFALAQSGWHVTTFEPMERNLVLIKATLCENPELAARINLHTFGLSAQDQYCSIKIPHDNVGNGLVRCSEEDVNDAEWEKVNFMEAGSFQLRRLQDVLQEDAISQIDFIKIDVEGYECEVLKGAGGEGFLKTYNPRLVKSEVWKSMARCSSTEYFAMFEGAGYHFGMDDDPQCKQSAWKDDPAWAETTKYWAAGANFYMCKSE